MSNNFTCLYKRLISGILSIAVVMTQLCSRIFVPVSKHFCRPQWFHDWNPDIIYYRCLRWNISRWWKRIYYSFNLMYTLLCGALLIISYYIILPLCRALLIILYDIISYGWKLTQTIQSLLLDWSLLKEPSFKTSSCNGGLNLENIVKRSGKK